MYSNTVFLLTSFFGLSLASSSITTAANAESNFTVALVRSPPPNWPLPVLNYNYEGIVFNISETVDIAVDLMHKAVADGANLIQFPELYFPGYVYICSTHG